MVLKIKKMPLSKESYKKFIARKNRKVAAEKLRKKNAAKKIKKSIDAIVIKKRKVACLRQYHMRNKIMNWYKKIHQERMSQARKIANERKQDESPNRIEHGANTISIEDVEKDLFETFLKIRIDAKHENFMTAFNEEATTKYHIPVLDCKIRVHMTKAGKRMFILSGDTWLHIRSHLPKEAIDATEKRRAFLKKPMFNMPLKGYLYQNNRTNRLTMDRIKTIYLTLMTKYQNAIVNVSAPLNRQMHEGGIVNWDFACPMPQELKNILEKNTKKTRIWDDRLNPRFDGQFTYHYDKSHLTTEIFRLIIQKHFKGTRFEHHIYPNYLNFVTNNVKIFSQSKYRMCLVAFQKHARLLIKLKSEEIILLDPWKQNVNTNAVFINVKRELNQQNITLTFKVHPKEQSHEGSCTIIAFARGIYTLNEMSKPNASDTTILNSMMNPIPCCLAVFISRLTSMNRIWT
jgi:hypothetical protein